MSPASFKLAVILYLASLVKTLVLPPSPTLHFATASLTEPGAKCLYLDSLRKLDLLWNVPNTGSFLDVL